MAIKRFYEVAVVEPPGDMGQTQKGVAAVSVRLVLRDRVRGDDGQWRDVPNPEFFEGTAYGQLAENIASSGLFKGQWLIAYGAWNHGAYIDQQGKAQVAKKMTLDSLAPDLRQGRMAGFEKSAGGRKNGGGSWGGQQGQPQQGQQGGRFQQPPQPQQGGWGGEQPMWETNGASPAPDPWGAYSQ